MKKNNLEKFIRFKDLLEQNSRGYCVIVTDNDDHYQFKIEELLDGHKEYSVIINTHPIVIPLICRGRR